MDLCINESRMFEQSMPRTTLRKLSLSEKLRVLPLHDDQKSTTFISTTLNLSEELILETIQSRTVHEAPEKKNTNRRDLCLGEKIRVLHHLEIDPNYTQIGIIFGVSRQSIAGVKRSEEKILLQETQHKSNSVRRPLFAKCPAIDHELMDFLSFTRSQRLPVTRSLLQKRTCMAALRYNIPEFKASNGYIQKFLHATRFRNRYIYMGKAVHSSQ